MSLVISTELNVGYDRFSEVEKVTREVLADHGFGILTEIDAKETLKKKIDADIRPLQCHQIQLPTALRYACM